MPDFIIKERDYDKVPDLLTTEVPSFSESEEYRLLDAEDRKVPGLVTAAFTRYFEGLQEPVALDDPKEAMFDTSSRSWLPAPIQRPKISSSQRFLRTFVDQTKV